MEGARKYVTAVETLARAGGYGFEEFEDSIKFIRKGNFVFECDYHARGKTLRIYLLKDMPPLDADEKLLRKKVYSSENALEVYGVISGQLGWSETYGYLVNNEIKHILSQILIDAVRNYNDFLNNKKTKVEEKEADVKTAYAQKVKEFEEFLLKSCKETAPHSSSTLIVEFFLDEEILKEHYCTSMELSKENFCLSDAINGELGWLEESGFKCKNWHIEQANFNVSNALKVRVKSENIITLEMIKMGLKQGLIIPKVEGDGLKCYIGEYFFFFGGSEFEGIEELSEIPKDVLPIEIRTALDGFNKPENREFETEYMYYYYYLLENLKEESDAE